MGKWLDGETVERLFSFFPRHFVGLWRFCFWFRQWAAGGRAGDGTDSRSVFIAENSFAQLFRFYRDFGSDELGHVINSD